MHNKVTSELQTLDNKINDTSMLVMEEKEIEKVIGIIYTTLLNYHKSEKDTQYSVPIIRIVYELLKKILDFHVNKDRAVTQNFIAVYTETQKTLLNMCNQYFNINENAYIDAVRINNFFVQFAYVELITLMHTYSPIIMLSVKLKMKKKD